MQRFIPERRPVEQRGSRQVRRLAERDSRTSSGVTIATMYHAHCFALEILHSHHWGGETGSLTTLSDCRNDCVSHLLRRLPSASPLDLDLLLVSAAGDPNPNSSP